MIPRMLLTVGILLAFPTFGNTAVTCDTVRWAAAHFTQAQINEYKSNASAEQVAFAKKCLATPSPAKAGTKIAKHGRVHKAPSKAKSVPAHKLAVVPLPRPKPVVELPQVVSPAAAAPAEGVKTEARSDNVSEYLIYLMALAGVVWFTWFVTSKGIVPAFQAIKGWATRGAADVAALNAEIQTLKAQVAMHQTTLNTITAPKTTAPPTQTA